MYDDFAVIYDQLMDDVDYDRWAEYYLWLLGTRRGRVTECACGTGNMTARLAAAGLSMTGVDLSRSMLRVAEEKMRRFGVNVPLICQNMCMLTLPRRADHLICTCDGVNYLTDPEDVQTFFGRAFSQIRTGGLFCFDFSTREKLEVQIGDSFLGEERDGLAYLWQNHLDNQHVLTMDITFFVREEDGRYRRFREVHRQRAHSMEEIDLWLHSAGFKDIQYFGEMRTDEPHTGDARIHVRARVPANS